MLRPRKKPLHFPRWFEWLLVLALLFTAALEFTHQEYFWTTFFLLAALLFTLSAARLFGRSVENDSDLD